uniref:CARD domain-containing protein n=1 Tax=Plectus sambesii TaxID=2011161 RepID=A0A914V2Q4_9BILA
MDEEHRNALERSLNDICQDLDAEDVLPYLRSKGIVKEGQAQEIIKTIRGKTQNMQLIDFIKKAGPSAFQEFINALKSCNQEHLAEKIMSHLSSSSQHLKVPPNNEQPKNSEAAKKQSNPPATISNVNSTPVGSNQGPPSKGPGPYPVLCQFCKVELTSQAHEDEHKKGRKHLNKKAAAEAAK